MMKWSAVTASWSRYKKTGQAIGVYTRTLTILMTGSLVFFLGLGVLGYMQSKLTGTAPSSSMKGLAASVSSRFFMDMMGMEVPHLQADRQSFTFSQSNISGFLFSLVTDINPDDPKTLIAREMPGMDRPVVLSTPQGGLVVDSPEDYGPTSQDLFKGENVGEAGSITANPGGEEGPVMGPALPAQAKPPSSAGKNVAFIYQSHNQESYLPELPGVKDPDKAYDPKKNVTLVGLRLAQRLEKEGIGAVHSDKNYPAIEKTFNYYYSYKYSFKTLQEAMAGHPDLDFYFDIHRDSQRRDKTTARIGGKDYAQIYFIIGGKNPKWKENYAFAERIDKALQEKYPGLSKGIHAKSGEGNGVYNQNFSPNSVLIEVGGVDNTLEECYRTVDALADAISEVILNAEKVDAKPQGEGDGKKQG
ncbi:stage II sporulation protein P [Paenibacillus mucilaginosus]|nr:stage II sporulation protein P [Paenibacillus mucilaginosus]AEI42690.1 stage II sporulation protein P (septal wall dissolution protein) [Paenibacillus mucilaginosus KNP414]AFH64597.1 stage II sporulation protein P [Paenibacillus mucilaginosus K02]MCG7217063.1 stage II sporulation protein P [Paenibacillus mucilaginosus]WDM26075.1 stage II sporulation protein P [Paenibacillus mucilaginosus]WFA20793.1 stage II sporulation protein P [Paenibacillus mucilaginosus]